MAQKMTGARLFAQMLKAYGVTHVFFMDAILRRALAEMEDVGIKRILGHSEKAVAYMADGYARVSGRPGVCMAQSVGAANLASGMQDPYLGHSAVIALTGRHVRAVPVPQRLPGSAARAALRSGDQVPRPRSTRSSRFRTCCAQAFREATTGTPRPVHLDIGGLHRRRAHGARRHVRRRRGRSAHALSGVPARARSGGGAEGRRPRSRPPRGR